MSQILTSITAEELRNLKKKRDLEHRERFIQRIITVIYRGVISQAEKEGTTKYVFMPAENFDIDVIDKFMDKHYELVISRLKDILVGCDITYADRKGWKGLRILVVDWS